MVAKNKLLRPFLKWAGGKRQLLPEIRRYVPKKFNTYFEPFLGAGAVLFDLQPKRAIVNDINFELINTYRVIKTDVEALIADLTKHRNENSSCPKQYGSVVNQSADLTSHFKKTTAAEDGEHELVWRVSDDKFDWYRFKFGQLWRWYCLWQ